jgi:hypothetical protein
MPIKRTVTRKNGKKTVTTTVTGRKGTNVTRTKTKGGGTKSKSIMGHVGRGGKVGVTRHKTKSGGSIDKTGHVRGYNVSRDMVKSNKGKKASTTVGSVTKTKTKAGGTKDKSTMGHVGRGKAVGVTRHKSKGAGGTKKRNITDTSRRRTVRTRNTTKKK